MFFAKETFFQTPFTQRLSGTNTRERRPMRRETFLVEIVKVACFKNLLKSWIKLRLCRVSNGSFHTQLLSSSVQLSSMGTALIMTTWLDLLVNYCKRQLVEDVAEHLEFA